MLRNKQFDCLCTQANESRRATDALLAEHEQLMESVSSDTYSTTALLKLAGAQQRVTDDLLEAVNASRQHAEDAVNNAEQTLSEAEQTLSRLRGLSGRHQWRLSDCRCGGAHYTLSSSLSSSSSSSSSLTSLPVSFPPSSNNLISVGLESQSGRIRHAKCLHICFQASGLVLNGLSTALNYYY